MQNVQAAHPYGSVIGERYLVRGLLGEGGYGAVYLVRDQQRVNRNISTLFVLKELINPSKQERDQITFEGMFLRRLHHRSLPRVHHVFKDDKHNRVYILMDYIEGPNLTLMRLREPEERFSLPHAMTFMTPIVDAVTYLHSQQPPIIHKNITPTNIILPHGIAEPVLVDFGIAKAFDPDSTNTAVRYFSFGYGAPEQYNEDACIRTDIYGLAATFYSLLTGLIPPDALYRIVQLNDTGSDPLVPANQITPVIPPATTEAIHRAMSISSNDRFSTVEEFWQDLTAHLVDGHLPAAEFVPSIPVDQQPTKHDILSFLGQQLPDPGVVSAVQEDQLPPEPEVASIAQEDHQPPEPAVASMAQEDQLPSESTVASIAQEDHQPPESAVASIAQEDHLPPEPAVASIAQEDQQLPEPAVASMAQEDQLPSESTVASIAQEDQQLPEPEVASMVQEDHLPPEPEVASMVQEDHLPPESEAQPAVQEDQPPPESEVASMAQEDQLPPEPEVVSSALPQPHVVSKKTVENIVAVSIPEQPRAPTSRKPGALLFISLAALATITVGAGLLLYIMGYHASSSATPISTLTHKTPPSERRPTMPSSPTPSSTSSISMAGSYYGTLFDMPTGTTTNISLTHIRQQQGNISGYLGGIPDNTILNGIPLNGPFTGTVTIAKQIQFIVTSDTGQTAFSFEGVIWADGTIVGSFCSPAEARGKCSNYGLWSVSPAT